MIATSSNIDFLTRRLRMVASRAGDQRARDLAKHSRQSRVDWHSPTSLWPDLGME